MTQMPDADPTNPAMPVAPEFNGPGAWSHDLPVEQQSDDDPYQPQQLAGLDGSQLAVCPTCGTGVAPSRLRQLD